TARLPHRPLARANTCDRPALPPSRDADYPLPVCFRSSLRHIRWPSPLPSEESILSFSYELILSGFTQGAPNSTVSWCSGILVFHLNVVCIDDDKASMAAISPCTMKVMRGACLNPESHWRISPESACADIDSIFSMCACTGTI